MEAKTVIIGAGPAGLAASYALAKQGVAAVCLEATAYVGGISRTVEHKGFRFDLGGHRFFTKNRMVEALWREVLGPEFLRRPRLSRIYFDQRFFKYPLRPWDVLQRLGPLQSLMAVGSYAKRRLAPLPSAPDFESWAINQFGDRLYARFFRDYTEKVWGIPCAELAADWGAQRIKGLSLGAAIRSAFVRPRHGEIKTLIEEFDYPRYGPGQMYEAMADAAEAGGVPVLREHRVVEVRHEKGQAVLVVAETPQGRQEFLATHVLASMPLDALTLGLTPAVTDAARAAARALRYRSLLTVNLMLDGETPVPDTWIYIQEPGLCLGRVQCFANWSPAMVPGPGACSFGCEYFVDQGDGLWNAADQELIELAKRELTSTGLLDPARVIDAIVIRVPQAYPVFDLTYRERVACIREALAGITNLMPMGRNGLFRYNNMDHSILTGLLAACNTQGEAHDIWSVNTDTDYHEEAAA